MDCPLHPKNNRPDLCHDCRRAGGTPESTRIELTQTCHGQLERVEVPMPGGRTKIMFRQVGAAPLKPKKAPADVWGHYTR